MFENLTDRLSQTLRQVTGKAKLTEDNIKETLREVRMALLEADVALPVVKDFVNKIKERGRHRGVAQPDAGPGVREDRPGRT
jgi:signal recognition particle subunit SRP54